MIGTPSLNVTTPSDREIQMTREFDAPRRLVFEALTQRELLKKWFHGPPGWRLTVCEFEARVGGSYRYVWSGPRGEEMGMGGTLREITPPERIVSTERFDQSWYPGEAVGTIELAEKGGKTTLTMTVRYESREARDVALKSGMDQGVSAGYDSLAQLLDTLTRANA